jgi:hypothetical protein
MEVTCTNISENRQTLENKTDDSTLSSSSYIRS